ncbi:YetF domain-containing protein [Halomonas sp. SBBP1]|nr:YetF domain-containing protein [Halomonas sp. SBBP1]
MLLYRGEFITTSMQKARVTQDEVQSAIRGSGIADVMAVEAVVLETDGSISVIKPNAESYHSSLEGVRRSR